MNFFRKWRQQDRDKPAEEKRHGLGIAAHRSFVSYIATIVEVAVDDKGKLTVPRVDTAIDCGTYVNPERIQSQIEGTAIMAAVAPVLFPEMKARGAKPGDLVALLSATGAQTETIPPSLVLITIGSVTGVSIAALFTGGLLPGVVLAITLSALVWWRYRGEDLRHIRRAGAGEIARAFGIALPAIALPFVIRYAVIEGIATATEVSTIGIVYAFIAGYFIYGLLIYRNFDWRRIMTSKTRKYSVPGSANSRAPNSTPA